MTFICKGTPHYGWAKKIAALSDADFAVFKRGAVSIRDKLTDDVVKEEKALEKAVGYIHEGFLMDDAEVATWDAAGVPIEVSKLKGLASPGRGRDLPQAIYQISVANVGLLQIQTVTWLEDCCTETLQAELDHGWRILAVCPPNDARRPTYVLGHFDKDPHDTSRRRR